MDYEGKNPKIFSKIPHLKHPFKMDIYRISLEETQFIWSDWTNGLVSTTNKDPTASKIQVAKANRLPLMNAVRVSLKHMVFTLNDSTHFRLWTKKS